MPDVEQPDIATEHRNPELQLWTSALALLVADARSYWQGRRGLSVEADHYQLEQAFDDVMRCGPMLRHLCAHTGHDAVWICEGFTRWCERLS